MLLEVSILLPPLELLVVLLVIRGRPVPSSSSTVVSLLPSGLIVVTSLRVTLRPSGPMLVEMDSDLPVPPPPKEEDEEKEEEKDEELMPPPPDIISSIILRPLIILPPPNPPEKKGSLMKGSSIMPPKGSRPPLLLAFLLLLLPCDLPPLPPVFMNGSSKNAENALSEKNVLNIS